jgi:hypothetical protein
MQIFFFLKNRLTAHFKFKTLLAMYTKRQKSSFKWQRIAPVAYGGLFSCLVLLSTMPAWHEDAVINTIIEPNMGVFMQRGVGDSLPSRKALNNAAAASSCSAKDKAYQAAIVTETEF